jgi:hypothetical protein
MTAPTPERIAAVRADMEARVAASREMVESARAHLGDGIAEAATALVLVTHNMAGIMHLSRMLGSDAAVPDAIRPLLAAAVNKLMDEVIDAVAILGMSGAPPGRHDEAAQFLCRVVERGLENATAAVVHGERLAGGDPDAPHIPKL